MRWLNIFFAILCAAAVSTAASGPRPRAYLPTVGAIPLRFQSAPILLATIHTWPALKMNDEPGTNALAAAAPEIASAEDDTSLEMVGPPAPGNGIEGVATNVTTTASSPVQGDSNPVVTPQMLMQFFTPVPGGTNVAPHVIVPGSFELPQSPGSSATYRTK